MRTIEQMIQSEVLLCVSSLVSTLALANYCEDDSQALSEMKDQAMELAAPIDDWEEAAIQAGWTKAANSTTWVDPENFHHRISGKNSAQKVCETLSLDPYQREVFEHWAVTDWFADKLEAAGEKVDRDFAGMCVWARTTTGQAIQSDSVIERIYAETHR